MATDPRFICQSCKEPMPIDGMKPESLDKIEKVVQKGDRMIVCAECYEKLTKWNHIEPAGDLH